MSIRSSSDDTSGILHAGVEVAVVGALYAEELLDGHYPGTSALIGTSAGVYVYPGR